MTRRRLPRTLAVALLAASPVWWACAARVPNAVPSERAEPGTPPNPTSSQGAPDRPDQADSSTARSPDGADQLQEVAGVHYLEIVTGGASKDAELPMVVAIHGLGDRPENFAGLFARFDEPARIILPRGYDEFGPGWSWFPIFDGDLSDEALAQGIAGAADGLVPAIEALREARPTSGKVIVTGFSQGGMLSFALAVRHGQLFDAALPISGWLPRELYPEAAADGAPRITAYHGEADELVLYAPTQEAVAALDGVGYEITLSGYPGVGHTISPAMRDSFELELSRLLRGRGGRATAE